MVRSQNLPKAYHVIANIRTFRRANPLSDVREESCGFAPDSYHQFAGIQPSVRLLNPNLGP
jgi:hypothetical protein